MTILQCTLRSTSRRLHCCRFYTSHALAWAHVHSQDTKPPRNATPRRNPLGPNKVDLYLASLRAAGLEPTSDDIERCRPSKHSHPSSPQYAEDYKTLVDRLCRSFSKEQLHKFAVQYGLTSTQSTRKVRLAEAIIEVQWNWPSLKAIEKHRRDTTEVSTKSFPLGPEQLFFILGKDGVDLLQMSMEYNVHIALTPNPLALRVEGLRGSLKKLTEHISELKKGIIEETFELPTKSPIRQDLAQRISRLAGAFMENADTKGMVRICVKDLRNLVMAKRLATRAVCEVQQRPSTPLLSYIPLGLPSSTPVPTALFPHTYALFPFLVPRSFPWTMNVGGAFRIRRVGEWLGIDSNEDVQSTGGLAEGKGHILTTLEKPCDLKRTLLGDPPETAAGAPNTSRRVTASLGHILLTFPGQKSSIVPPLNGFWVFPKILAWLRSSDAKLSFVPSLPTLLLNSPPTAQKILHRLIYRALPTWIEGQENRQTSTKIIKCEVVLAQPQPPLKRTPARESETVAEQGGREGNVECDTSASGYHVPYIEVETSEDHSPESNQILPLRCWIGTDQALDLMMPDRPMDIHFSVFHATLFTPGQEPTELQKYMTDLRSFLECKHADIRQPEPPLTLTHGDDTYVLHANASVRQSNETLFIDPRSRFSDSGFDATSLPPPIQLVSESILDLESHHKSTVCQVMWDAHESEEGWKEFLHDCDYLSSIKYRPVGGKVEDKSQYTYSSVNV